MSFVACTSSTCPAYARSSERRCRCQPGTLNVRAYVGVQKPTRMPSTPSARNSACVDVALTRSARSSDLRATRQWSESKRPRSRTAANMLSDARALSMRAQRSSQPLMPSRASVRSALKCVTVQNGASASSGATCTLPSAPARQHTPSWRIPSPSSPSNVPRPKSPWRRISLTRMQPPYTPSTSAPDVLTWNSVWCSWSRYAASAFWTTWWTESPVRSQCSRIDS
mmetsp:Transcript_1740/g.4435  ORF Transcript_1740/g.4435 Transcript_1740/m.4435 type:complete len:225 (-) Transcript_1740:157-831(-)